MSSEYRSAFQIGFTLGLVVSGVVVAYFPSTESSQGDLDLFWARAISFSLLTMSIVGALKLSQDILEDPELPPFGILSIGAIAGLFTAVKIIPLLPVYAPFKTSPIEVKVGIVALTFFPSFCLSGGIGAVTAVALWRGINYTCGAAQDCFRRRTHRYVEIPLDDPHVRLAQEARAVNLSQ